jgi:hypothetical protein
MLRLIRWHRVNDLVCFVGPFCVKWRCICDEGSPFAIRAAFSGLVTWDVEFFHNLLIAECLVCCACAGWLIGSVPVWFSANRGNMMATRYY